MVPKQEYVLLADVQGHTVDELLAAILDGNINAYCEFPEGRRHVPMNYAGELLRYARINHPVYKDGHNITFGSLDVMASDGKTVRQAPGLYSLPVSEARIRRKDIENQCRQKKPEDVFYSIAERARDRIKQEKGKVTHRELHKELRRLAMDNSEVASVIKNVSREGVIFLTDGKEISFSTFKNRVPVKK